MSSRVLIVDNYDSYTYNLVQAVAKLTGELPEVVEVDDFDLTTESSYAAIIVSPGPGHPGVEPSFRVCLELFRRRRGPTLGVCLGHQGLVLANGGFVGRADPAHGVVEAVFHDGSLLFHGVPQGTQVVRYHSLAAMDVPPELDVTARSADGVVMAVAHRERPHLGVQFHPESVLSSDGERMLANFLDSAGLLSGAVTAVSARGTCDVPAMPAADLVPYPRWIEPADAAATILKGKRRCFWLDSADTREWTGRYSVLGYLSDEEPSVTVGSVGTLAPGVKSVPRREFLALLSQLEEELPERPFSDVPAVGGWVGVAGYDVQEVLPALSEGKAGDGFFMKINRVVVFDHRERTVGYLADSAAKMRELHASLRLAESKSAPPIVGRESALSPRSRSPWNAYRRAFHRAQEALFAGDTYEAVLTFPIEFDRTGDPLADYLSLRRRNPAPYAAFLRHDSEVLLSSSPERMVAVRSDGATEVRPIKGTLPRALDRDEDERARLRLKNTDKFRRENLMITDLVRNDLGRVCTPGSVEVTQLMGVESYERVHQLVTAVCGQLRNGITPVDCLRAVFPAGSMTGAPKRRTMELIREIEWEERGGYAGALGWFTRSSAEFSVVIRTLQSDGGPYRLHVGGGIIIGSTQEDEFAEALDKARSVAPVPFDTADVRGASRRAS